MTRNNWANFTNWLRCYSNVKTQRPWKARHRVDDRAALRWKLIRKPQIRMRQRLVPRSCRATANRPHNRNGGITTTHRHHRPSAATEPTRSRKMPNCSPTKPKSNNLKWKTKDVFSTTNSSTWCPITWFSPRETSAILYPFKSTHSFSSHSDTSIITTLQHTNYAKLV